MSIPEALRAAAGDWTGEKHLYLPGDPTRTVPSTATVGTAAQGRFCTLAYRWSFEGQPQDGLLLIGQSGDPAAAAVTWIDSWHMGDQAMLCQGPAGESGPLTVRGTYTVEHSPEWGWRIDLEAGGGPAADRDVQRLARGPGVPGRRGALPPRARRGRGLTARIP